MGKSKPGGGGGMKRPSGGGMSRPSGGGGMKRSGGSMGGSKSGGGFKPKPSSPKPSLPHISSPRKTGPEPISKPKPTSSGMTGGQPHRPSMPSMPSMTSGGFSGGFSGGPLIIQWEPAAFGDDPIVADIQSLETDLRSLGEKATFARHHTALSEIAQGLIDLNGRIQALRARGYIYRSFIETKLGVLQAKWTEAEPRLNQLLANAENDIHPEYNQVIDSFNSMFVGRPNAALVAGVRAQMSTLSGRVDQIDNALYAVYSNISSTYQQTRGQISEVETTYENLDAASFRLIGGENPIQSVNAQWWRDGKGEGPEGILYLTDQRLLFEQKEKVATRKVLFITTESELVQQLAFEADVVGLTTIKASSGGLLGGQDYLEIVASGNATLPTAFFHLKGQDSEAWAVVLGRAKSGEIATERVSEAGQGAREAAFASAPAACTSCGAPLPELTAMQRQQQCEYCGTVMRW